MEMDPFFTDIPAVHCPNCGEKFLRPEDLEVHRERHRPISHRVKGAANCPKGCRRWLLLGTAETQVHLALCDGAPPLNGIPGTMNKKWFCPEHNFGTDGPRAWGVHKLEHHGGKDPIAIVRKPKPPEGPEAIAEAIMLLRRERERLGHENARVGQDLHRVNAALQVLENTQAS